MGNLFCPNVKERDYQEMVEAFQGNEEYVHYLWNNNKGNPLFMDHKGTPSLLFEDLLVYASGDRLEAMRLKSLVFNYNFRDYFGDWLNVEYTPETNNVYENGEPAMDNILDYHYMDTRKPGHMDPLIRDKIEHYNKKGLKGEEIITDNNNPYSWKIEEQLGLLDTPPFLIVPGEPLKVKNLKGFTDAQMHAKIKQVEELGGWGYPVPLHTGKFGVGVGFKIGRPIRMKAGAVVQGNRIYIAGKEFTVDVSNLHKVQSTLQLLNGTYNLTSLLSFLSSEFSDEISRQSEIKEFIKLFLSNKRESFVNIKVEDANTEGDYSEYDPNTNTIHLYSGVINSNPTAKGFIAALTHEISHAILSEAMINPQTNADRQFRDSMLKTYQEVLKNKGFNSVSNKYGLKNVNEFLTVFMTDSKFAADLKKYNTFGEDTRSFYQKIIDSIVLFFRRLVDNKTKAEYGENLYEYVKNTITNYINSKTSYYTSTAYNESIKFQREKAGVRQEYEDIKRIVKPGYQQSVVDAILALGKLVVHKHTDTEHSYKEVGTGEYFTSVNELLVAAGLRLTSEDIIKFSKIDPKTQREILTRAGKLGDAIHLSFEAKIEKVTDDIFDVTGFVVSKEAREGVARVLKHIKDTLPGRDVGKDLILLSEVVVADPYKETITGKRGVAGKIDLVIVDPIGRIHIFDFKTKENLKSWHYYTTKKEYTGYSSMDIDRMQIGMYKHILEKGIGAPVSTQNLVMLNTTTSIVIDPKDGKEYPTIGSIDLDSTIIKGPKIGIFTTDKTHVGVSRYYGESPLKHNWSQAQADLKEDAAYLNSVEYQLHSMEANKLSDLDKLTNDMVKILERKLEIVRKRYAYSKYKDYEEFISEIIQESTSSDAIRKIVLYASGITKKYVDRYNLMREKGEPFTIQLLMEWRDYILSYEGLKALNKLLIDTPNLLNDPTVLDALNGPQGILRNMSIIEEIYETQGKIAIAKYLTPHYKGFIIRRKEELTKKYSRLQSRYENNEMHIKSLGHSAVLNVNEVMSKEEMDMFLKGTTLEDYTNANLLMEKDKLEELTYQKLLKELSVAASDVNELARWIDTLEDARDPVVSAMISAFTKQDEKSRIAEIRKRTEVLRAVRKYEDAINGRGTFTSEKEIWDRFIETDSHYLLRPWLPTFDAEERAIRKSNKSKTEQKARKDMQLWRDSNFKMSNENQDKFLLAMRTYLETLVQKDKITPKEKEIIMSNATDVNPLPVSVLAEWTKDVHGNPEDKRKVIPPRIRDEAADYAMTWIGKNFKLYATLDQRWVSNKWLELCKEIGIDTNNTFITQIEEMEKSTNPIAQMYIVLRNLVEDSNALLPYNYRIGYRFPGIEKSKEERARSGQSILKVASGIISQGIFHKTSDIDRQETEFTDEKNRPKYFIPIHYTKELSEDDQSYDLPTILFRFWSMANDHRNKRDILPEMEMAKYFVQERTVERSTSTGMKIYNKAKRLLSNKNLPEDEVSITKTNVMAAMVEDWFQMYVYGNATENYDFKIGGYEVDGQKLVSAMQNYVSVNLLAFNVVQGFANVGIGEIMTQIDAIAGEWINIKLLAKGTKTYLKFLPGMAADFGSRAPEHVGSLLVELFNALGVNIAEETSFANATKLKGMMQSSALSIFQLGGEHWLRVRALFAMLHGVKAIGKDGKELGSIIDHYYVEDGILKIRDNVDLEKSKWTTDDQTRFMRKFHGIMYRFHGAYGPMEKVAAQRYIIGQLAYMYRKFVYPGLKRRYGKMEYIERLQQSVEGNYRTTAKFFANVLKAEHGLRLSMMSEEWGALSPHEKANIKRTLAEIAYLISIITLARYAYKSWGETDDPEDERLWAFIAYQAYRLKAEMLFYSPKLDEAYSLLRSPFASMSMMTNLINLSGQLFSLNEVYERGPWKGHYKIERDIIQMIPIWKQFYKVRDIEEQIQWFR